jgi:hypothetical protein
MDSSQPGSTTDGVGYAIPDFEDTWADDEERSSAGSRRPALHWRKSQFRYCQRPPRRYC